MAITTTLRPCPCGKPLERAHYICCRSCWAALPPAITTRTRLEWRKCRGSSAYMKLANGIIDHIKAQPAPAS